MLKIYWLYELQKGQGVYQGCAGVGAEGIVRRVVEDAKLDPHYNPGEAFPVICLEPNGMEPIGRDFLENGYMESDTDFVKKNMQLAVALLEAAVQMKKGV